MTHSAVPVAPVTDALVATLAALGDFEVGDGGAPESAGSKYAVVYGLPDNGADGPANDPWADVQHVYQITAVGQTRKQAEWVADVCRAAILNDPITISGRQVIQRRPLTTGPVERDDDMPVPLFYSIATYELWTTPA